MDLKLAKKVVNGIKWSMQRNQRSNRPVKEISITAQDILDIYKHQNEKCYWTKIGLDSEFNKIPYHPLAISADRKDNKQPYSKENVVLTMRILNLGRREFSENEFPNVVSYLMEKLAIEYIRKKDESSFME